MAVSGQFTVHGITFTAQSLEVQYQAAHDTIDISGGAGLSLGGSSVNVTLGDHDNPGIVVDHGALTSLDATITGNLNLFGVSLQSNNLEIQYAHNQVTVSGGVGFSVGDKFGASISIDHGGVTVDTRTGAVSINTANLAMSGTVTIGGATVGGNFALDGSGHLNSIGVNYAAGTTEGLEMGDTGLFITAVSGSVQNLRDLSHLEVDLSVTADEGGKITLADNDYALVEATGKIHVTPTDLTLDGTVKVGGGLLASGTAHVDLNWGTGVYTVGVNVGMYDDSIQYGGTITVNNKGDISIDATAGVYLPADTPSVIKEAIEAFTNGSDNLGQLAVHIEIDPGSLASSYGSAMIDVNGSPVIGFQVDGTGHFTLIGSGAAAVAQALQEIGQTAQEAGQVLKDAYNQTAQQATQLLNGVGYTYDQVASALQNAYQMSAQQAAQIMKDAGYYSQVVAYALKDVYNQTAQQTAQLFSQIGYGATDIAAALTYAYKETAQQAAQILSNVTHDVTQWGFDIGQRALYSAEQIGSALRNMYYQTAQQATQILSQLGYDASSLGNMLKDIYGQTAQQAAQILHGVTHDVVVWGYDIGQRAVYSAAQIGSMLQNAYQEAATDAGLILNQLGYDATTIAGVLKNEFGQTAQQVESFLQNTLGESESVTQTALNDVGYAANDVNNALQSFGNDVTSGWNTFKSWF